MAKQKEQSEESVKSAKGSILSRLKKLNFSTRWNQLMMDNNQN